MSRRNYPHFAVLMVACMLFICLFPAVSMAQQEIDDRGVPLPDRQPKRVAALSGSLADMWLLAGGSLVAATQDAWDEGRLTLDDNVVCVGGVKQARHICCCHKVDVVLLILATGRIAYEHLRRRALPPPALMFIRWRIICWLYRR